ncbi:MAG: hypothetical protein JNK60_11020, partial [Acidobacteria bacterium]|nr:hypothetical protein [Acidobacteriota bacterium]
MKHKLRISLPSWLRRTSAVALSALMLLTPVVPAEAQSIQEGVDPLRQIGANVVRANLAILFDVTGSMGRDIYLEPLRDESGSTTGNTVGVDSV